MLEWIFGLSTFFGGPVMVWAAGAVGVYLMIRSGFVPVRYFGRSLAQVCKGGSSGKSASSFRALATALSGTLGTGNIAGVAVALSVGGAGSIFWMWVSAFFGMATKYTEIVLAVRYRRKEGGVYCGGPMYYLPRIPAALFSIFCVAASFGVGNIVQANTAFCAVRAAFPDFPNLAILAVVFMAGGVFCILRGGMSGVSAFLEKALPLLAGGYIVLCLAVFVCRPHSVIDAFSAILSDAFSPMSALGGTGGYCLMRAMRTGCAKGIFTNEAGLGSAPIAHASADCVSAAEQGLWGIFEVFFDTIVMCTLTAIVVLGAFPDGVQGNNGIAITMDAFSSVLGSWAGGAVGVSVLLFAFISILAWGGYALEVLKYCRIKWRGILLYIWLYAAFVILSIWIPSKQAWECADILNALMLLPNLFGLIYLSNEMQYETMWLNARKSCGKQRKHSHDSKKGGFCKTDNI